MELYQLAYFLFSILFVSVVFISMLSAFVQHKKRKKLHENYMKEQEEMIYVEHLGERMPIRREEMAMWNGMSLLEKKAMVYAYRLKVKKGQIKVVDGGIIKTKKFK